MSRDGLTLTIDAQSLKAWEQALRKLGEKARQVGADVIKETLIDIDQKTVELTPVETGRLQQSWTTKKATPEHLEGKEFTNVEYAPSVEFNYCNKHQIKHKPLTNGLEYARAGFNRRLLRRFGELMR